jgi:hypothetical protein
LVSLASSTRSLARFTVEVPRVWRLLLLKLVGRLRDVLLRVEEHDPFVVHIDRLVHASHVSVPLDALAASATQERLSDVFFAKVDWKVVHLDIDTALAATYAAIEDSLHH